MRKRRDVSVGTAWRNVVRSDSDQRAASCVRGQSTFEKPLLPQACKLLIWQQAKERNCVFGNQMILESLRLARASFAHYHAFILNNRPSALWSWSVRIISSGAKLDRPSLDSFGRSESMRVLMD